MKINENGVSRDCTPREEENIKAHQKRMKDRMKHRREFDRTKEIRRKEGIKKLKVLGFTDDEIKAVWGI